MEGVGVAAGVTGAEDASYGTCAILGVVIEDQPWRKAIDRQHAGMVADTALRQQGTDKLLVELEGVDDLLAKEGVQLAEAGADTAKDRMAQYHGAQLVIEVALQDMLRDFG